MKTIFKSTLFIITLLSLIFYSCDTDDGQDDPIIEENACMEFVDVHDQVKSATQMFFLNALEGWMIGNNPTGMAELLHTTDGGQSWVVINDDLGFGCCFSGFKFHFTDSNHGYMTIHGIGNYFYTTDKGVTWNAVPLPDDFDIVFDTYGMGVNSTQMVYAARIDPPSEKCHKLYFVSNTTHTITSEVVLSCDWDWDFQPIDIHFTDSGIINMSGNYSGQRYMAHSEDFGASWTYTEIEYPAADHSYMEFVNDNVGYLAVFAGISSAEKPYYKTVDGGATWIKKTITSDNSVCFFTNFAFADENNGIASQSLGEDIYKTTDGGDTWTNISCSGNEDFSNISRIYRIAYPSIDNGIILSSWMDIDAEEDIDLTRNRVYFYTGE